MSTKEKIIRDAKFINKYGGKYIGIIGEKIVSAKTIKKIKKKAKKIMKEGERCIIEYIEKVVSIY